MTLPIKLLLIIIFLTISTSLASKMEDKLINHLLANYAPLSRPVPLTKSVLMVGIGINIYQIVEVNEKHQYMTSVLHLWRNWTDENLTWNVSQFDNITYVRIPSTRIWQPDVFLYNMGNEEMLQSANNREILNVIVNHTGTVLSVPPKMLKSICRMDVTWFPWDEQKCDLIFGSWTYSGSEMDFTVREEENMMRYYIPNGEWHLVGIKAKKVDKFYECCSDSYPSVVFTLHIKRNSMYYLYNLIVPCALIGEMLN